MAESLRRGDRELIETFGARLQRARLDRSLTQNQVAQSMAVTRSYVAQIENGQRQPSLTTIVRVATAVGVDPGELLDGMRDVETQRRFTESGS